MSGRGIVFFTTAFSIGMFVLALMVPIERVENSSIISPLAPPLKAVQGVFTKKSVLDIVAKQSLANTKGTYAVVIKHLKTGEEYSQNEDRLFESASLYKLWVMGEVYESIAQGKLTEDTELSQDIAVLNEKFRIASDEAELKEGRISLTVKESLEKMITVSDNYAALLLSEKVRNANIQAFIKSIGLTNSSLGVPPKTTAKDTTLFLEKLYKGELANPDYTQKMLLLLKKQKLNNKLPKHLPKNVEIAHKTGELGNVTHDAGIVYTDTGDYVIVVLTESNTPKGAEERIAKLSRAVYKYFTE